MNPFMHKIINIWSPKIFCLSFPQTLPFHNDLTWWRRSDTKINRNVNFLETQSQAGWILGSELGGNTLNVMARKHDEINKSKTRHFNDFSPVGIHGAYDRVIEFIKIWFHIDSMKSKALSPVYTMNFLPIVFELGKNWVNTQLQILTFEETFQHGLCDLLNKH